jgi:hypothetical protein
VNDPNAGRSLSRSVDRMLRDGRGAAIIVELHGSHLPTPLVAALIGNLRRVRQVGGMLAVNAATPDLRGAIALHGLDRVLDREPVRTPSRRPNGSALAETAWPVVALLALTVTIAAVAILLQLNPGFGGL